MSEPVCRCPGPLVGARGRAPSVHACHLLGSCTGRCFLRRSYGGVCRREPESVAQTASLHHPSSLGRTAFSPQHPYIWILSAKLTSELWGSSKCWLKFVLVHPKAHLQSLQFIMKLLYWLLEERDSEDREIQPSVFDISCDLFQSRCKEHGKIKCSSGLNLFWIFLFTDYNIFPIKILSCHAKVLQILQEKLMIFLISPDSSDVQTCKSHVSSTTVYQAPTIP
ncbi:uncharacterized protein LOC128560580 [Nycticebus coucang]|uniref:uncharacterized protein LOC128560580 n=1 Tax=Nycticebus coucang TaxID=9470 RepID=UPI00234C9B31|nr:uncharacterized protein LOC128560580 [Nycticebus coucang]